MTAAMQSTDEIRPVPSWFPEEAATGVVVAPAVSSAAVVPDEEPAELVAFAARLEAVLLALVVAVALEAKPR